MIVLAVAAAAAALPQPQSVTLDGTTTLVPSSFAPGRQPDGNSVVLTGPSGVIVFDTGRHTTHTDAVLQLVKATGKPLVAIINSHWHLDHVSGNVALRRAFPAAKVYATGAIDGALTGFLKTSAEGARVALAKGGLPAETEEDIRGDLATIARGDELRPDVVLDSAQRLSPGGRRLLIHVAPHAATAGDVWIEDKPRHRVLVGDLVTLPAPFLDTACPEGWQRALADVAAVRFDQLVPGHGAVMNRADFEKYRSAFGAFLTCANGASDATDCAKGWLSGVGSLVTAQDAGRATGMIAYYVRSIRAGRLRAYCS